jgi:hypothetical protein
MDTGTYQSGVDKQFIRQPSPRSDEALFDFSGLCVYLYAISEDMLETSIRMHQKPTRENIDHHARRLEQLVQITTRMCTLLGLTLDEVYHRQLHNNLGAPKKELELD